jgi:uncharacterized repeat protein (TIGR03843 family)
MTKHRRTSDQADFSAADHAEALALLSESTITACEPLPWGSNYSFAVVLSCGDRPERLAVYKPRRGEAPLWDFPSGTLYKREQASYLLSRHLGWPGIPPTVVRDGPHGVGTVQLYVEPDDRTSYQQIRRIMVHELRRMAIFDLITNNADRKAGHCLVDLQGRLWGIDHGLTFHSQHKLRTVIWDFAGEPLLPDEIRDLEALCEQPREGAVRASLGEWLPRSEINAFYRRVEHLALSGVYPELQSYRSVPWGW